MNDGETTEGAETAVREPGPRQPPLMGRYVNAKHKIVVYMTIALRMREGGSPERIGRTISRMEPNQVPIEGKDIARFSHLLAERMGEALDRPDLAHQPSEEEDDKPGLVLSVAREVFGELSFVEQIALDVSTAEMIHAAVRSGDPSRTMHRIVADVLRDTAEVLKTSIEPSK